MTDDVAGVRVDKWLWSARFYKTRSLASDAVSGGKVQVNGDRVKPAKPVHIGDEVRVRIGPFEHVVQVRAIAQRRGPRRAALLLYEETAESVAARARLAEQLRLAPPAFRFEEQGRPTKKNRRELARFIDRGRQT